MGPGGPCNPRPMGSTCVSVRLQRSRILTPELNVPSTRARAQSMAALTLVAANNAAATSQAVRLIGPPPQVATVRTRRPIAGGLPPTRWVAGARSRAGSDGPTTSRALAVTKSTKFDGLETDVAMVFGRPRTDLGGVSTGLRVANFPASSCFPMTFPSSATTTGVLGDKAIRYHGARRARWAARPRPSIRSRRAPSRSRTPIPAYSAGFARTSSTRRPTWSRHRRASAMLSSTW
jgi:hypothetical protein